MSPLFHYRAVDKQGTIREGVHEAASDKDLLDWLYQSQLTPLKIKRKTTLSSFKLPGTLNPVSKIQSKHVREFTQSCSNLLKSGFPIDKAISTISHTTSGSKTLSQMCHRIFTHLEEGQPLSWALKQTSPLFSSLYISLIKAGEQSGQLTFVFQRLDQFLKEQYEFRKTVRSILLYPCLVMIVSIVSIAIMLGFVVPRFAAIFEDLGQNLPAITQVMVHLSNLFRHSLPSLLITLALIGLGLISLRKRPGIQNFGYTLLIRLPYLGELHKKIMMARFASTLGMLLEGGLTIVPALNFAQGTVTNPLIRKAIAQATAQVTKGVPLHRTMQQYPHVFPSLLIHMLAVGAETGNLSGSLSHIAETYENDVRSQLKTITTMLSPLLILAMGLVIALIIAAMLLPLLSATDIQF